MDHKEYILPQADLSHDEGDPRWHDAQASGEELGARGATPVYAEDGTVRHYRWNGLAPGHYRGYWQLCVEEEWDRLTRRYEENPDDVHAAYWYLDSHPVYWEFSGTIHPDWPENHVSRLNHSDAWLRNMIEITPHKVNPDTEHTEDDSALNTAVRWWYETGPSDLTGGCRWHDTDLDGGAFTFELAVIEVARKIHDRYGNDRRTADSGG